MAKKQPWRPFEEAAKALRDQLTAGEQVLAEGRADEFDRRRARHGPPSSGNDYLLVTDRRLIVGFAFADDRSRDLDLPWENIKSYKQQTFGHQWLVLLTHLPTTRRRYKYRPRFLWMAPRGRWKEETVSETAIRFSRPETHAAIAIRQQLETHRVPRA